MLGLTLKKKNGANARDDGEVCVNIYIKFCYSRFLARSLTRMRRALLIELETETILPFTVEGEYSQNSIPYDEK